MNKSDSDLQRKWVHLSTPDLESMLQTELEKDAPDDDTVLQILHILEAREPDAPLDLSPEERAAYERYKQRMTSHSRSRIAVSRWLSVAASLVLIVGLLFAVVPQEAEAETFWEMLQRLSGRVIEFFDRDDIFYDDKYVFKTENEGLQLVYEAVLELGVTEPVVPMWLPDGFVISEHNIIETPMLKGIYARFSDGDSAIVYKMDLYDGEPAHQYYKDGSHYESYEKNGTIFNITKNLDDWLIVWTKDNIECSMLLDCQEDTLRRILESIYVMEDN